MKYNSTNKPLVCMQTHSKCYKNTTKMEIKGVLWHSTGANNPTLKRYVQPWDSGSGKEHSDNTYTNAKWLEILGKNTSGNDWNHIDRSAGLNCWIGKLADGSITTVQTMPWDYKPWGCGAEGLKYCCNNGWIQFEICEDGLTDNDYFTKAYKEACEITAYLCKMYKIDPLGTVSFGGKQVPTILCHADSYKLGVGGNHGDVYHWFKYHGKTMDSVRQDVLTLLNGADPVIIQDFGVKAVGSSSATISFSVDDNFKGYNWTYNLTNLRENKAEMKNKKFTINSKKPDLALTGLTPNEAYSLELIATDKKNSANVIKAPGYRFFTAQDYPGPVSSITFNQEKSQVSFKPPASWGSATNRSKGYTIKILVNGYEKASSDSLIAYKNTTNLTTVNISSLLNKVTTKPGDTLQVELSAWTVDNQSKKICAQTGGETSAPTFISVDKTFIDKIFLSLSEGYQKALVYLNLTRK